MGNAIIVVIIVLLVVIGLKSTLKHFKGEGSCCGGGGGTIKETKKPDAPKIGTKEVLIEGMHCENCQNSVERAVNKIDGAVCKVNLRKNRARIDYSKEISDEVIKQAIEEKGFTVRSIQKI